MQQQGDYQNISYQPGQQQPIQQQPQGFNPPPGAPQQQYYPPPQQQPPMMAQQQQLPPQQQYQQPPPQQQFQQPPHEQQPLNTATGQQASPMDKLMTMSGVFIKQKLNVLEAFTGCVQQNRYAVFHANEGGEQNSSIPFLDVKEESTCFQRQCLPSVCRAFELKFNLNAETYPGSGQWQEQLVVSARKDCTCTYLCMNRPELSIYLQTSRSEYLLGKIRNPFYCCHLGVENFNDKDQFYTKVLGSCCQLGVLCPLPCEACQEVDFEVMNAEGQVLVPLKKKSPGCLKALISTTDNFSVIFPGNATRDERILILASALFIDYMYFNDRPENEQQNVGATATF